MQTTLDRFSSAEAALLEVDETFLAAGRAEFNPGAVGLDVVSAVVIAVAGLVDRKTKRVKIPHYSIWAATERRLLIWRADRIQNKKATDFVVALTLGDEVNWPRVHGTKKTATLTVRLKDQKIMVTMPTPEALQIARAIKAVAPPPPGG